MCEREKKKLNANALFVLFDLSACECFSMFAACFPMSVVSLSRRSYHVSIKQNLRFEIGREKSKRIDTMFISIELIKINGLSHDHNKIEYTLKCKLNVNQTPTTTTHSLKNIFLFYSRLFFNMFFFYLLNIFSQCVCVCFLNDFFFY